MRPHIFDLAVSPADPNLVLAVGAGQPVQGRARRHLSQRPTAARTGRSCSRIAEPCNIVFAPDDPRLGVRGDDAEQRPIFVAELRRSRHRSRRGRDVDDEVVPSGSRALSRRRGSAGARTASGAYTRWATGRWYSTNAGQTWNEGSGCHSPDYERAPGARDVSGQLRREWRGQLRGRDRVRRAATRTHPRGAARATRRRSTSRRRAARSDRRTTTTRCSMGRSSTPTAGGWPAKRACGSETSAGSS